MNVSSQTLCFECQLWQLNLNEAIQNIGIDNT
jgi:hypothetical protein